MRVTTVFNRVLRLDGASVVGVAFTDDGVVVTLRSRARHSRVFEDTVALPPSRRTGSAGENYVTAELRSR